MIWGLNILAAGDHTGKLYNNKTINGSLTVGTTAYARTEQNVRRNTHNKEFLPKAYCVLHNDITASVSAILYNALHLPHDMLKCSI